MQKYIYTARDSKGKIIKGVVIAENEIDLANKTSQSGYFLTNFKITQKELVKETYSTSKPKLSKMNSKELLHFTINLATLIDGGILLLEGLNNLITDAENERIKKIIRDIYSRIEAGSSLKEALSSQPQSFSKLYTAIIGAGEATGSLPKSLNNLAELLEWQEDLKAKIKEATTYPLILFFVMIGVVSILITVIIPKFKPLFEELGAKLPLPTQVVLNISLLAKTYWWIGIGLVFLLSFGYKFFNSKDNLRYQLDSWKLKLPILGQVVRKVSLSRFSHVFAIAFNSGINLLTALDIAKNTTGNTRVERALENVKVSVNVGGKLADSLNLSEEFPSMMIRMVGVGEETGSLSQSLNKVAQFYDKEVAQAIKRMFTLFEPIMIIIMGVVVGGIAISIILPMVQMTQLIGG